MAIHVIVIAAGNDIREGLITIAQQYNANLTVLNGSGLESNITLRNSVSHTQYLPIQGPIQMIQLQGSCIIANPPCTNLSVCLSSVPEQLVGGIVEGSFMAAGRVVVTVILSRKAGFQRVYFVDGINKNVKGDDNEDASGVVINDNQFL